MLSVAAWMDVRPLPHHCMRMRVTPTSRSRYAHLCVPNSIIHIFDGDTYLHPVLPAQPVVSLLLQLPSVHALTRPF